MQSAQECAILRSIFLKIQEATSMKPCYYFFAFSCRHRNTCTKCLPFLVLLLAFCLNSAAQTPFERGKKFYQLRHANADSFRADVTNINKAIEAFQTALDKQINPEQSAAYLLRSYYFKGMFGGLSKSKKQEIFDKGHEFGERMMDQYPKSVPIKFWYGANTGKWADVHGAFQAATNGIAGKLREVCKEIIKLDPKYQGGGGYRILAQVHFYSPSIPLVMGWPSDKKALQFIEKAMEIAPEHPANRMLYAQVLLEFNKKEKAHKQFQFILNQDLRPTHVVEDRYLKHRSRELLNEHF